MSKSLKITLFLTFLLQILRGQNGYQNLIVNPSFEQRIVTVPPRTVDMMDSIEEFVGWPKAMRKVTNACPNAAPKQLKIT